MKNIILIFMAFLLSHSMWCQFTFKGLNLYGISITDNNQRDTAIRCFFYDVDNDEDLDAIVVGLKSVGSASEFNDYDQLTPFVYLQKNTGDKRHPLFAPRTAFLQNVKMPSGYFYPAFTDFNQDHIMDLVVCCDVDSFLNLNLVFYKGKSDINHNTFEIFTSQSLNINGFAPGSFVIPAVADMDKDNDLDILASGVFINQNLLGNDEGIPGLYYLKNNGTPDNPKWNGWYINPYRYKGYNQLHFVSAGDTDNDGDQDLLTLTQLEEIWYFGHFSNSPLPNGKPIFEEFQGSLLNLPAAIDEEYLSFPELADIDGDGDLDIFVAQDLSTGFGLAMYENQNCDNALNTTVTNNSGVLMASATGKKYQWINCLDGKEIPLAVSKNFMPVASGNYSVKITDPQTGCIGYSDCINVTISNLHEINESDLINIYPNPANQSFEIINNTTKNISGIKLMNATGETMLKLGTMKASSMDISFLPSGCYIVSIDLQGQWINKRLVVVR